MWKRRPPQNPYQYGVPADTEGRALALVDEGKLINAIKLVREETGMGLKEAKDYVDALRAGHSQPPLQPMHMVVSPQTQAAVLRLAHDRKVIEAVKLVREETGRGLKECKDYVDALYEGRIPQTPITPPPPLPGQPLPGPPLPGQPMTGAPGAVPPGATSPPGTPLSVRVRAFKAAEDFDSAIAVVRAETGMSRDEAVRFIDALDEA